MKHIAKFETFLNESKYKDILDTKNKPYEFSAEELDELDRLLNIDNDSENYRYAWSDLNNVKNAFNHGVINKNDGKTSWQKYNLEIKKIKNSSGDAYRILVYIENIYGLDEYIGEIVDDKIKPRIVNSYYLERIKKIVEEK